MTNFDFFTFPSHKNSKIKLILTRQTFEETKFKIFRIIDNKSNAEIN